MTTITNTGSNIIAAFTNGERTEDKDITIHDDPTMFGDGRKMIEKHILYESSECCSLRILDFSIIFGCEIKVYSVRFGKYVATITTKQLLEDPNKKIDNPFKYMKHYTGSVFELDDNKELNYKEENAVIRDMIQFFRENRIYI